MSFDFINAFVAAKAVNEVIYDPDPSQPNWVWTC